MGEMDFLRKRGAHLCDHSTHYTSVCIRVAHARQVSLSCSSISFPFLNNCVLLYNKANSSSFQHWIVIGGQIKVLLLDFEGSFTLLIPNVEHGKAFRANSANVEVQRKDNGQQQLTFMKFTFSNPPMEISAPVLQVPPTFT